MVSVDLIFAAVVNGLVQGMILVLLSIGLSLVFGLMRVVNFAHGVFYMMGAYFVAATVNVLGFFPSLLLAVIFVGIFGGIVEYIIIRPLYDEDHILQIFVTFAITLSVTEAVRYITETTTGTSSMSMNIPSYLVGFYSIGPTSASYYETFIIAFGAVVTILLWLALVRTDVGSIVRGATRDPEIIRAMGINIQQYWTGLFAFGCGLAALAGGISAPIRPILPDMGITILILVFVVVLVGGLGSYVGTVIAGLLIGQVMAITGVIWSPGSEIVAFGLLIVVLLLRPEGLMGEPEVLE